MNNLHNIWLDPLLAIEEVEANFIPRIMGVEVSTDRERTVNFLEPTHRKVVEEMGLCWDEAVRAEQVHGNVVKNVTASDGGSVIKGADGLITNTPGVVLGIYVADCGVAYLVDKKNKAIGLVHSGKKGTEGDIVGGTIAKMCKDFGTDPEDLIIVLAPCIRPPHYEVDFAKSIREQALCGGVLIENYHDCGICTASDLSTYYSYRAEKGNTGRMLALLSISAG